MTRHAKLSMTMALFFVASLARPAENGLQGHWSGSIETPQGALSIEVDLANITSGWIGSISIPDQGASGLPLDRITAAGEKCSFHIHGAPGDPTFNGTLSPDRRKISGSLSQGGSTMSFQLARSGEAKVERPKTSAAVAAQFVGTWVGTLDAGQPLRLKLRISNEQDGAHAVMISLDQGDAEIPVSSIQQTGMRLVLELNSIGGKYEAELNKEGKELSGTWSQGGGSLPLSLRKSH